jgi:hypothetical protein
MARTPQPPYLLGDAITRAAHARPYVPSRDIDPRSGVLDPLTRSLEVYTRDPSTPRGDVARAVVQVPYEPLGPGPDGALMRVELSPSQLRALYQRANQRDWPALDLDALPPGYATGLACTTTDPRFAAQMVYAVAMCTYERFRKALGRVPDFAVPGDPDDRSPDGQPRLRLVLRPHAMHDGNAYYVREEGGVDFGWARALPTARGLDQPGGLVLVALSHDIIAHEVTHAMLDGLRAHFMLSTNSEVGAFHEGFADLVALFQRFQFTELVANAIEREGVALTSRLLNDIARQFGAALGDGRTALRSAVTDAGSLDEPVAPQWRWHEAMEYHDLGALLVAAVFDAFRYVYRARIGRYVRLVEGTALARSHEFVTLLAEEASKVAGHFLEIIIRAVDYCPPVDLRAGEFLRAVLTADFDVVADDKWGYREAFVRAFRRYGIRIEGVVDLTEDALRWRAPEHDFGAIPGLAFEELRHGREPGMLPPPDVLAERAHALGRFITHPDRAWYFGIAPVDAQVRPPVIESVRTLRRIGPDGTISFDLVAEVSQRRHVRAVDAFLYGGSTLIIGADGRVRYAICKQVGSERREAAFTRWFPTLSEEEQAALREDVVTSPVGARRGMAAARGATAFLKRLHAPRAGATDRETISRGATAATSRTAAKSGGVATHATVATRAATKKTVAKQAAAKQAAAKQAASTSRNATAAPQRRR